MTATRLDPELFRDRARDAAKLLRTMSNAHRLLILCRLDDGELSAGELLQGTGLSQSALSQHLAVLRAEGLVATRRAAQTIFYRIADPSALLIIDTLAAIFCPEETQT